MSDAVIDNLNDETRNNFDKVDRKTLRELESLLFELKGDTSAASILKASGLLARAYSKFVLTPQDVAGGIQDVMAVVTLLTTPQLMKGNVAIDYAQIAGLISRAVSTALLEKDYTKAAQDVISVLQLLKVLRKVD